MYSSKIFRYYLPLEKDVVPHLNKLESPPPKDHLCKVWLKLALWFWRRFLNIFNIILQFSFYLHLEKSVALQMNKLKSPPPKDDLCQVWLKLGQWFWRFLNIFNIILLFRYYPPLEKGVALHLNNLESPSHKDALCQVWLKLAQWFWRRRFLNIFM